MSATRPKQRHIAAGTLVSIGLPLLDITTKVDDTFLVRHGLCYDDVLTVSDVNVGLLEALQKRTNVEHTAGGAAQNALRVTQWILNGMPDTLSATGACIFYGTIGDDQNGERLRNAALRDGLNAVLETQTDSSTGICWVLICNATRLLIADMGASLSFDVEQLKKSAHWNTIIAARVLYFTAHCLVRHEEMVMLLAEHAYQARRTFVFNLSSTTLLQQHPDKFMAMLPYVDVLIGNCDEMMTLAALQGFTDSDDCADFARDLAYQWKRTDEDGRSAPETAATGGRTVVVTQSEGDVVVAKRGWCGRFAVPKFQAYQVVDMNGVGDAFAGGFLAQMIAGMGTVEGNGEDIRNANEETMIAPTIEDCVRCGIWAAGQIMGRRGCSVGGPVEYRLCKCDGNKMNE